MVISARNLCRYLTPCSDAHIWYVAGVPACVDGLIGCGSKAFAHGGARYSPVHLRGDGSQKSRKADSSSRKTRVRRSDQRHVLSPNPPSEQITVSYATSLLTCDPQTTLSTTDSRSRSRRPFSLCLFDIHCLRSNRTP